MSNIKVITEPSIYFVGRSCAFSDIASFLIDSGFEDWSTDTRNDPEYMVELAGRLRHMSFKNPRPGGNKAYIKDILDCGHGSVLEHVTFSFIVAGVSRSLTNEWISDRNGWMFSQLNQCYIDESNVAFVVPPALLEGHRLEYEWQDEFVKEIDARTIAYREWRDSCQESLTRYAMLTSSITIQSSVLVDRTSRRKHVRETARSVLPNCTETKIFATANAMALRHFVEFRGSLYADDEIRRLAIAILEILKDRSPNLFDDLSVETLDDGREYVQVSRSGRRPV